MFTCQLDRTTCASVEARMTMRILSPMSPPTRTQHLVGLLCWSLLGRRGRGRQAARARGRVLPCRPSPAAVGARAREKRDTGGKETRAGDSG
eukprot:764880-Hanusia_phi.AAC.4